ncbi:MAG: ATP-binding protein [Rhodocyclaceae bacterium]|nr:ATP-binding protein [Rhodocyclaceae bacterium]
MIKRQILPRLKQSLAEFPAVALLGPRQVGKTTLAHSLAGGEAVFLDLERPADLARLRDAETYLESVSGRFVIVDEVQRMPELFPVLRVLIDRNRRAGRFLLLGSASPALRRQAAESLAGRIDYLELAPFTLDEVGATTENLQKLLLRGGFPESYLAPSGKASLRWRHSFIRTFIEQDLPQLGINIPAAQIRRFWQMLAHLHGQIWNASQIAASLGLTPPTMRRYLDILADTYMVRILPPLHANLGKRLVKSPRVYLRDSGLLHALLGVETLDALLAHPIVGAAWEGTVIEHLVAHVPQQALPHFYRTVAGAELDLVLESSAGLRAFEAKFGLSPRLTKGYHQALADLGIACGTVVYTGNENYRMAPDARVAGLQEAIQEARSIP